MNRLFVAIELPPEVKEGFRSIQEPLKKSSARLTLVDPDLIHITLKFIGDTPDAVTRQIADALGVLKEEPFPIQVKGISGNNIRQPRVIWANVEDGGKCGVLHSRIEDHLAPFGVKKEDRAFRPHATVARVKEFHPDLIEFLKPLRDREFGNGMVSGFSLKKSTLTPKGPIYQTIKEVLF